MYFSGALKTHLNFINQLANLFFTVFYYSMKILNGIRTITLAAAITLPAVNAIPNFQNLKQDKFEITLPPPKGSSANTILTKAPSPFVTIAGEKKNAVIVVDLSRNVLYKYNKEGNPEIAYRIASGKKRTPTDPGVRIVTHVEKYPYSSAPTHTKRRRNPRAYGPNTICLNKINTKTGEQSPTGEFIHGNCDASSIGKYASLGCMRMDNEVIKVLSAQVKRGDIVIINK